jgi:hypothetical protein
VDSVPSFSPVSDAIGLKIMFLVTAYLIVSVG